MSQIAINVKRELFRFESHQDWVNKAQSRYANCGVKKGFYITVDARGHVMHLGLCFKEAEKAGTFPAICYELETNWEQQR